MAVVYVVEVRQRGGKDWRPVKAYLTRGGAERAAGHADWPPHVEARVAEYVELPEGTQYKKGGRMKRVTWALGKRNGNGVQWIKVLR